MRSCLAGGPQSLSKSLLYSSYLCPYRSVSQYPPTNSDVFEAEPQHESRIESISPVKHQPWGTHLSNHVCPVCLDDLPPLGEKYQRLSGCRRLFGRIHKVDH